MVRGIRRRLYPTRKQREALEKAFGCCRYVYNWALRLRTDAWFNEQKRVSAYDTMKMLTVLKRSEDHLWLNDVSAAALQNELFNLQSAFVNFWEKRTPYPKFKSRHDHQSAKFTRNGFYWKNGEATVFKLGKLKTRGKQPFSAHPTSITISKVPSGRYYVSYLIDEDLPAMPSPANDGVGIDLGLTAFASLSTGEKITAPKSVNAKRAQLRRAQKSLSRKQKGSKNREKARVKVARIYESIADTRKDFLHKLTTRLVRENQTIAVEDLNVRGMTKNRRLARSISEQGWGEFVRQLEYKCEWYGRTFVKIDRWYPSSKRCSGCGHVVGKMPLSVREWDCPKCGSHHDRDANAAKNILAAGYAVLACGDGVRPKRSKERRGSRPRSRNSRRKE